MDGVGVLWLVVGLGAGLTGVARRRRVRRRPGTPGVPGDLAQRFGRVRVRQAEHGVRVGVGAVVRQDGGADTGAGEREVQPGRAQVVPRGERGVVHVLRVRGGPRRRGDAVGHPRAGQELHGPDGAVVLAVAVVAAAVGVVHDARAGHRTVEPDADDRGADHAVGADRRPAVPAVGGLHGSDAREQRPREVARGIGSGQRVRGGAVGRECGRRHARCGERPGGGRCRAAGLQCAGRRRPEGQHPAVRGGGRRPLRGEGLLGELPLDGRQQVRVHRGSLRGPVRGLRRLRNRSRRRGRSGREQPRGRQDRDRPGPRRHQPTPPCRDAQRHHPTTPSMSS